MELLLLVVLYVGGVYYGLTFGIPLLWRAMCFAVLCLLVALKYIAGGALWLVVQIARGLYWLLAQIGLFLYILLSEWRRGPQADEAQTGAAQEQAPDTAPGQSPYEAALGLLGLTQPFTQADLSRVYRQAMKSAHTDVGGSKEEAQALNAARDFLKNAHGWT